MHNSKWTENVDAFRQRRLSRREMSGREEYGRHPEKQTNETEKMQPYAACASFVAFAFRMPARPRQMCKRFNVFVNTTVPDKRIRGKYVYSGDTNAFNLAWRDCVRAIAKWQENNKKIDREEILKCQRGIRNKKRQQEKNNDVMLRFVVFFSFFFYHFSPVRKSACELVFVFSVHWTSWTASEENWQNALVARFARLFVRLLCNSVFYLLLLLCYVFCTFFCCFRFLVVSLCRFHCFVYFFI